MRRRLDRLVPAAPAVATHLSESSDDDAVSILIPAYNAEAFLDRTLYFARGQSHGALRILVSIDKGTDDTARVANRHAASDSRVTVQIQPRRLGWADNINALLDAVETPYFFIYPHDDIILPQYTPALLDVLRSDPTAVSAHCDMGHFGGGDHLSPACDYTGPVEQRLFRFLVAFQRGSPLRSLVRTDAADGLRLPTDGIGGLWANEPFLMDLVARGPAKALHEGFYLRWDKREGGLTDGWTKEKTEALLAAYRLKLDAEVTLVERHAPTERDANGLKLAVLLQSMTRLREIEDQRGEAVFEDATELDPRFAGLRSADLLERVDRSLRADAKGLWKAHQDDPRIARLA